MENHASLWEHFQFAEAQIAEAFMDGSKALSLTSGGDDVRLVCFHKILTTLAQIELNALRFRRRCSKILGFLYNVW